MPNFGSHPTYPSNGTSLSHPASDMDLEIVALDEKLREEMKRLASINDELLGKRPSSDPELPSLEHFSRNCERDPGPADDPQRAKKEILQLRQRVNELERMLEEAAYQEATWQERLKEYENLLEEKSEVIRDLHLRLQEVQESQQAAPSSAGRSGRDVEDDEIRAMKAELEEARRQLQEDEDTMMRQMREMEMALARDRAELSRQRNEIQRVQADLNREIELAQRDSGLRERLANLQRRDSGPRRVPPEIQQQARQAQNPPSPTPAPETPQVKKSGFWKLFG